MCGISGIIGADWTEAQLGAMIGSMAHRGPDDRGKYIEPGEVGLGHDRLAILDKWSGRQPMTSRDGNLVIVFNGEIYNYLELRQELSDYGFQTRSDTEVILAAYQKWGAACLDHFVGMFAFAIWDKREKKLFLARDRFGVKPLYFADHKGNFYFASEIKALWAAGVPKTPNARVWATYLTNGVYDADDETFWEGIHAFRPGYYLYLTSGSTRNGDLWYDLPKRVADTDGRPAEMVMEEYLALLRDAVKIRFRSDVPVGVNLSGGLDSSILLALVDECQLGCKAFTFVTDTEYDEDAYISPHIGRHPWSVNILTPQQVKRLAVAVKGANDEPFGGLPTIAYASLFERAYNEGVTVLLDGNGADEQWAGYDYYGRGTKALIQGTKEPATRPGCLMPDFRHLAREFASPQIADQIKGQQLRDITITKLPHNLRFNDRISMRVGLELRSPFLDHRLVELALRQPPSHKIQDGVNKYLLRRIAARLIPYDLHNAPKRPVQTPQREWLQDELNNWAWGHIDAALAKYGGSWLDKKAVYNEMCDFSRGIYDNSFFVWQWISLGMMEG